VTILTTIRDAFGEFGFQCRFEHVISNPHLWNGLNDPYLYQTFVEVYNGSNLTDLVSQPLGSAISAWTRRTAFSSMGSTTTCTV